MKKYIVIILCNFIMINLISQTNIEWSSNIKLKLADFKSAATEINKSVNQIQITVGSLIEFNYNMSRAEFMFTKNFNSKVKTIFKSNAASIVAPDSLYANELVEFSNYHFNLTELFARKFRKELFESKGVFSDGDFYKKAYDKAIEELSIKFSIDTKATNFGHDKKKLDLLNKEVLTELELLADYCQTCKPKKKK